MYVFFSAYFNRKEIPITLLKFENKKLLLHRNRSWRIFYSYFLQDFRPNKPFHVKLGDLLIIE